jgi:fluoroacetyl-CoA thioesterase
MALEPGLTAIVRHTVTPSDTAEALGSGDVAALGTPRVVGLCEEATVAALVGHTENGATTVGQSVQINHLLPSPIGATVTAEAVLETREGRRLKFRVALTDGDQLLAAGRIQRVVVNRDDFLARLGDR